MCYLMVTRSDTTVNKYIFLITKTKNKIIFVCMFYYGRIQTFFKKELSVVQDSFNS